MGVKELTELKCWWRCGIGGQSGRAETGWWKQFLFPKAHKIVLHIWDSNQITLPLEPAQYLAVLWGWIKSCICSENHVGLPGILHANDNPELSTATIYTTGLPCNSLSSLSPPLPLLTEIATDSDGLGAASMVNICLLMTWNRQGQLVKTWDPLWIWGLNTSFWCLCLRGFSPWNWSLPLHLHISPGGVW